MVPVVARKSDIRKLQPTTRKVRVVGFLSKSSASSLLARCPRLETIVFTQSARRSLAKDTVRYLVARGVGIVVDTQGPGRPAKLSRIDLLEARNLRKAGASYSQIANHLGISRGTVVRALKGITQFRRWAEDYNTGDSKVVWMITHDADPAARELADRHYSRKTPGATHFCGPGEKLVLITPDYRALFVWRKNKIRWDGQKGVECTLFRNEGAHISSELIREAVRMAREKWPGERLFTYVRPSALKSTSPGFCFIKAGWRVVGKNRGRKKLILLEGPDD
jgi:hypothetical protein